MPTDNNESYDRLGNSLQDRKTGVNAETAARSAEQGISLHNRPTRLSGPTQSIEAEPPSGDGRYVDRVEIGRGGMGVVWKAHDVKLDRLVAIKRVLPGVVDYDGVVSRFLAEARALAKVTHPNIVGIYDQGHDQFGDYIVMEYVEGANVLELIKQRTTLSVDDSVRLVRKICEGLHEAHRAGIIHRDIKPSNILVDKNGRAKLTDFGLARLGGSQGHSLSGQVLGTEGYMAPEQYDNPKNATAASDQYSLAATLYHMVTGRSPRMIHLRNVPDVLQDILSRALDEHTDQRFPSIAAFHAALGQIPRSGAVQANTTRAKVPAAESTEGDSNLANLYAELRKKAETNLLLAKKCFEEYEDTQAIEILKGMPDELIDKSFEEQVRTRVTQGTQLEKEIEQRVREMRVGGLRQLVRQFLELYPKRMDMVELLDKLPQPAVIETPQTASILTSPGTSVPPSPATTDSATTKSPQPLVAPFDAETAKRAQESWAKYLSRPVEWTNSIGIKFRLIPPGEFLMGATNGEDGASDNEMPYHKVRITEPFYLGIYPVTQAEYQKVTGSTPSHFKGATSLPVEQVSWDEAQTFLTKLTLSDGAKTYRLSTEAEWEYACRAGTTTPFWFGAELNGRQANSNGSNPYGTNNKGQHLKSTTPVGKYAANPFGIFDQHGQVWEWCQDWYAADYYQQFASQMAVDPTGPESGSSRCLRGGCWGSNAVYCRSACRYYFAPFKGDLYIGFRAACGL